MDVIQDNRTTAFIGYSITYLRNKGYQEGVCTLVGTLVPFLYLDSHHSVWNTIERLRTSLESLTNAGIIPIIDEKLYTDLTIQLSGLYRSSHWDVEDGDSNE